MQEHNLSDTEMNELEKENQVGSTTSAEFDGNTGRTIPINDQEAIERGESFSDELDGIAAARTELADDPSILITRIADLEDRLVRSLADYDNLRKRSSRQLDEMSKQATDGLILEILEVLDNVERAEAAFPVAENAAANDDPIRKGLTLIHQQLSGILTRRQIEAFESVDQRFDAKLHEALMQLPDPNRAAGIVAMEIVRGYKQGERIIRHAKVGVSSGTSNS